jgi:hypothetical protein
VLDYIHLWYSWKYSVFTSLYRLQFHLRNCIIWSIKTCNIIGHIKVKKFWVRNGLRMYKMAKRYRKRRGMKIGKQLFPTEIQPAFSTGRCECYIRIHVFLPKQTRGRAGGWTRWLPARGALCAVSPSTIGVSVHKRRIRSFQSNTCPLDDSSSKLNTVSNVLICLRYTGTKISR